MEAYPSKGSLCGLPPQGLAASHGGYKAKYLRVASISILSRDPNLLENHQKPWENNWCLTRTICLTRNWLTRTIWCSRTMGEKNWEPTPTDNSQREVTMDRLGLVGPKGTEGWPEKPSLKPQRFETRALGCKSSRQPQLSL